MKHYLLTALCLLFLSNIHAQEKKIPAYKYKHMLSAEEENLKLKSSLRFTKTNPPNGSARSIAEWEPMSGVVIAYPFGIPLPLIKALASNDTLMTLVSSSSDEQTVRSIYANNGVNLKSCKFVIANTDSYWTRDYSPLFMVDANKELGIVDFIYNRPRPNDNTIPEKMAAYLDVPIYGMNVVHTGGNYMTDGMGAAASTTIVHTESKEQGFSNADVDKAMLDYLGISKHYVLEDPNNTYIDHIDCWGKFLDVDKILIRKVPSSHAQYNALETMASYWKAQVSSWGNTYQVFRVNTPNNEPYTNSLILNGKVFVPLKGNANDNVALEVYRNAMPGYDVQGFVSSQWLSTDALHCRTHEIADKNMLEILHKPLFGEVLLPRSVAIKAEITPLSKKGLYSDSLFVFYRFNDGDWKRSNLIKTKGNIYQANVPMNGNNAEIDYYIQATDSTGRTETHPYIGKYDPHTFMVGKNVNPYLSLSYTNIDYNAIEETEVNFSVSNQNEKAIVIEDILTENLGFAQVNYENEITFPYTLEANSEISMDIKYLMETNSNLNDHSIDTLKIMTNDSTYNVILKLNKNDTTFEKVMPLWGSKITPNPFTDFIDIDINFSETEKLLSIQVVNSIGQLVENLSVSQAYGNNYIYQWHPQKQLVPGLYFILVKTDTRFKSYKILKI